MSDHPSPRRAVPRRPVVTLSAAFAAPRPPHPAKAATPAAAASPTAADTEWRDGEPFDGGALRGCALALALPGVMALWLAVEIVLWLTGAR